MKKKTIKVVGAIIENDNNEILCALRKKDGVLGNLWEFPGGKLEENEDIYQCIVREIKEELDVDFLIEKKEIFSENIHEYNDFIVHLYIIKGRVHINSTLKPYDHDAFLWLKRENLSSLNWAPADIPAVEKICKTLTKTSEKIFLSNYTDEILEGMEHIYEFIQEGRFDVYPLWIKGFKLEVSFIKEKEFPEYFQDYIYKVFCPETRETFLVDELMGELKKV